MTLREAIPYYSVIGVLIAITMTFFLLLTRRLNQETKKYFLLGIAGIYAIGLFFFPTAVSITGIFIMLLVLMSLEKWNRSKIFLILSPIITYPLFIGLTANGFNGGTLNLPLNWYYSLTVYIFLFSLIYGFLLKNFWHWIFPKMKKILAVSLIAISIFAFAYSLVAKDCYFFNQGGKGGAQTEIEKMTEKCRLFHLYSPEYYSNDFSGAYPAFINLTTQGPIFISTILVLFFLFLDKKSTVDEK